MSCITIMIKLPFDRNGNHAIKQITKTMIANRKKRLMFSLDYPFASYKHVISKYIPNAGAKYKYICLKFNNTAKKAAPWYSLPSTILKVANTSNPCINALY